MNNLNSEVIIALINAGKLTVDGMAWIYENFNLCFEDDGNRITGCELEAVELDLALVGA